MVWNQLDELTRAEVPFAMASAKIPPRSASIVAFTPCHLTHFSELVK
jgi:hypothetical protein